MSKSYLRYESAPWTPFDSFASGMARALREVESVILRYLNHHTAFNSLDLVHLDNSFERSDREVISYFKSSAQSVMAKKITGHVSYAHIYVHIWHMTFAAFLKSCCKVLRGRISVRTPSKRGPL